MNIIYKPKGKAGVTCDMCGKVIIGALNLKTTGGVFCSDCIQIMRQDYLMEKFGVTVHESKADLMKHW